jgi:putative ABC transport system permease protein
MVLGASAAAGIVLVGLAVAALLSGNASFTILGALLFLFGLVLVAPALVRPISLVFGALVARTLAREGTGMLAEGNLVRQPTRAAITASTSMVAMAILVVCGGLALTISNSFLDAFRASLGSDYLLFPPAITVWGNNVGADSSLVEQIKAVDGVGPVSSLRFASTTADVKAAMPQKGASQPADGGLAVALLGVDPLNYPRVGGLRFEQGRPEEAFAELAGGRTVIVNGIFAAAAGLKLGDSVPLLTLNGQQPYRVVGIASDYLNAKVATAYVSQDMLSADFGKAEDVFIQFNLRPGADRAQVEAQLKPILQRYPQFTLVSGQEYYRQTVRLVQTAFAGMYVLFIFLAVPSLIAMLNTLAIGVIERTREIGMLRAVGSTQQQVRRMILAEGLLLAAIGTAFGLLAGLYLSYAMIGAFRMAGLPVDYAFPWNGLVFAAAIGLLFGALAAVLPARQAARLEIVQALRYE